MRKNPGLRREFHERERPGRGSPSPYQRRSTGGGRISKMAACDGALRPLRVKSRGLEVAVGFEPKNSRFARRAKGGRQRNPKKSEMALKASRACYC